MFKKILLGLLVVFIAIQFFRPTKNLSAQASTNNIRAMHNVPAPVDTILKKACNDCHSNNTKYPWYAEVQPVAWWLDDHIIEGKHELNFDEFKIYSLRKQYHKLEETIDMVKKNEMPLSSYTIIHTDAKLNDTEKKQLFSWASAIMDTMKATYPIDSLIRKK
jgi:hypothetical protein